MTRWSLKLRSLLLAIAAIGVFVPVTAFTLDRAFTSSLTQAKLNELRLMNLSLISAFEFIDEAINMPDLLFEEQLNLPDSGYLGFIIYDKKVVWKSLSSISHSFQVPEAAPKLGEEVFKDLTSNLDDHGFFSFSYTAEFEKAGEYVPVQFYILNNKAEFNDERSMFASTVWRWLLWLSAGLVTVLLFGISLILSPVRKLIDEITNTAKGNQATLVANYPPEFDELKSSINGLIESEEQQRARYKNSLGDLAHSLKTPLAAAMGSTPLPDMAKSALQDIDILIQRQLKRAAAGGTAWSKPINVSNTAKRIGNALNKVYKERQLSISVQSSEDVCFYGDEADLMELLGNVLDNACKAAQSKVQVNLASNAKWTFIYIEDDGPGVPKAQVTRLLERGTRLDTYNEGQGIGMAVVADIVDIYKGKLAIDHSELGGARFTLQFPAKSH